MVSETDFCHLSTSRTERMTLASGYVEINSVPKNDAGMSATAYSSTGLVSEQFEVRK